MKFLLLFAHLIVPLMLLILGTPVRKNIIKTSFSFAFRSLNRTFVIASPRYSRSEKHNKNEFFFCFSLT